MKNIVTYHGLLQILIEYSDSGITACVLDPYEGRYILPIRRVSALEEAQQLIVTAIAMERGTDERTIRMDLRWGKPLHNWKAAAQQEVI